jgi:hypothetical protein
MEELFIAREFLGPVHFVHGGREEVLVAPTSIQTTNDSMLGADQCSVRFSCAAHLPNLRELSTEILGFAPRLQHRLRQLDEGMGMGVHSIRIHGKIGKIEPGSKDLIDFFFCLMGCYLAVALPSCFEFFFQQARFRLV